MELYCDEAGFTGNDLLETSQPYFVYAAVNFTQEEIDEILKEIHRRYPVQNGEIKGKILVKNFKGQALIKDLFRRYGSRVKFVYHDKKYALAAKMVEYGIEPFLSSNGSFYAEGLNRYLALGLYYSFEAKRPSAEGLFTDFQRILRRKEPPTSALLAKHKTKDLVLEWFLSIVQKRPETILESITTGDDQVDKWIADLTTTSLFSLLSAWGQHGTITRVICDDSKVFNDSPIVDTFNAIGKAQKRLTVRDSVIGYDLDAPLEFESSVSHGGIQLADLFSSVIYYCLTHRTESFTREIFHIIDDTPGMMLPDVSLAPHPRSFEKEFTERQLIKYQVMMEAIKREVLSS